MWTGTQAKERGLVDVLGTYEDALAIAAEKAGVAGDYKTRFYPVQKSFIQEWLSGMEENAETKALKTVWMSITVHIATEKIEGYARQPGTNAV